MNWNYESKISLKWQIFDVSISFSLKAVFASLANSSYLEYFMANTFNI